MHNKGAQDVAASSEEQQHHLIPNVFALGKPGGAYCGCGVGEALEVINTLKSHDIPCCVTGAKALVYYGGHRVPMEWDICVPTDAFDRAKTLLTSSPLNEKYELWQPVMPQLRSLVHTYPRFTLKDVDFFFILMPAWECLVDCAPEQCEHSPSGIPYPKLHHFAQSLLDTQNYADLEDLVDSMNVDEAWGEAHLRLDDPEPIDYVLEKNERILRSLPDGRGAAFSLLTERPNRREKWLRAVTTKRKRIGVELRAEKYETRFRKVGSRDPREKKDREV